LTDQFSARDYWQSRLSQSYSLQGVGYQRLGKSFNQWMYKVRARVFARVASRLGVDWSRARVLDVGSGTGFYVEQWHALGVPKVVGVDITPKAIEELQRRFPTDDFLEADIGDSRDSRLATRDFTAVSAMDVLFHIVDDARYHQAFRTVAASLAPGGWFLWSDNFLHHATERVIHQASRSLAESEDAIRAAGFEIVERVPMFVLMNYPTDTNSRLARLAWTAMVAPAALAEPLGWLVGAALAPLDTWLTSVVKESPTTEIMGCRLKTGGRDDGQTGG
jgi:2-polyprenyl-3-methyl-5-hydroxy-6-metoxy-1,4-benzoquinol methylase